MGAYRNLMQKMSVEDPKQFRMFTRMSASNLEDILRLVGLIIAKTNTNMREAICAKERMAVTLRFLATGMLLFYLSFKMTWLFQ